LESRNPTARAEDRGAAAAVSAAFELGHESLMVRGPEPTAASVSNYAWRAGLDVRLETGPGETGVFGRSREGRWESLSRFWHVGLWTLALELAAEMPSKIPRYVIVPGLRSETASVLASAFGEWELPASEVVSVRWERQCTQTGRHGNEIVVPIWQARLEALNCSPILGIRPSFAAGAASLAMQFLRSQPEFPNGSSILAIDTGESPFEPPREVRANQENKLGGLITPR
jgi:hypothetical protein